MKFMRYFACSLAVAVLVSACAKDDNVIATSDAYSGVAEQTLYANAQKSMQTGSYDKASLQLESLENQYPFGRTAQAGLRDLMFSYYKSGDVAASAVTAKRYTQLYPRADDVDYAYYIRGISEYEQDHGILARYLPFDPGLRDLGTMMDAYNDFDYFTKHFPNSRYIADVRQRMIYLRNMFAKKELNAAEFYLKRQAYVAAAMRASMVIKHFEQSPQTPRALEILAEANRHLGLNQEENDANKVLQTNFAARR